MATEITMPQLSDTMDQGTILKWFKKVGDSVSRGDALAEVATDKADLEIESFDEGTLLEIRAGEGETVKVGALIAVIGQAGEQSSSGAASGGASERVETPGVINLGAPLHMEQPPQASPSQASPSQVDSSQVHSSLVNGSASSASSSQSSDSDERVKISPLAKNIAKSHGIDYSQVSGSGEGGRITKKDVEKLISSSQIPEKPAGITGAGVAATEVTAAGVTAISHERPLSIGASQDGSRTEPLSKMRQTIASRMVESVTTAPHFYATSRIEVDALLRTRGLLKTRAEYEGITVTHMITKAVGLSLKKFPRINSKYDNGTLVQPLSVNIGIITALPDGLLIPVLKNADTLSLAEVVQESHGLIQRARAGKPKSDDLQGGTFSISNIGKNEVEHFTAIINPGQGAILAVSSIQDEALVKDAKIVPGKTIRVTLSVDHRIIDGVMAGEFLTYLKGLLEEPVLIFA